MRCYILRHEGVTPPGINPITNQCYVIENSHGEFTTLAVMQNDAEGANLLKKIPLDARIPINLLLCYKDLPNGTRQLTIEKLLHFRWHQQSAYDIGRPLMLQP
jgi:hypothetical protein